ncbi:hypothetical protein Y1Q_0009918 [Alligator mississippiensis]|uniref:Uncharacterized protein n=1 Tax=Alligator mississippiensis TaxID=8496 RepID=A0A151MXG1_ALLMI|nr:hypothetical protein Y1Q_0009918 [Alligator mississippiensis]
MGQSRSWQGGMEQQEKEGIAWPKDRIAVCPMSGPCGTRGNVCFTQESGSTVTTSGTMFVAFICLSEPVDISHTSSEQKHRSTMFYATARRSGAFEGKISGEEADGAGELHERYLEQSEQQFDKNLEESEIKIGFQHLKKAPQA